MSELEHQEDPVLTWRLRQLVNADCPVELAEQLAARTDVDLHDALDLLKALRDAGADTAIAGRILL